MAVNVYPAAFGSRPEYELQYVIDDSSQSIANNRTNLSVVLRIVKVAPHSGSYLGSGATWNIYMNGVLQGSGTTGYDFRPIPVWGFITLWSGTIPLQHDSNGYPPAMNIQAAFSGGPLGFTQIGPGPAVRPARIPRPPAAPTITSIDAPSSSSIALAWSLPDAKGGTISSYRVQYATNSSFTAASTVDTGTTTRSRTLSGLQPGNEYWVRVAARNEAGLGSYSAAQKITVGIGGSRFNGSSYVDLSTAKRLASGGAWTDLTIARRLTSAGWVDLS